MNDTVYRVRLFSQCDGEECIEYEEYFNSYESAIRYITRTNANSSIDLSHYTIHKAVYEQIEKKSI